MSIRSNPPIHYVTAFNQENLPSSISFKPRKTFDTIFSKVRNAPNYLFTKHHPISKTLPPSTVFTTTTKTSSSTRAPESSIHEQLHVGILETLDELKQLLDLKPFNVPPNHESVIGDEYDDDDKEYNLRREHYCLLIRYNQLLESIVSKNNEINLTRFKSRCLINELEQAMTMIGCEMQPISIEGRSHGVRIATYGAVEGYGNGNGIEVGEKGTDWDSREEEISRKLQFLFSPTEEFDTTCESGET
ncbi:uncharacterized protein J8A68_000695 [[Candida] subhashii]|uniref:Uncharacterized protein n=1 Tax=[Candida] subhashii TaxID=561895 RepID=A0A8J5ULJ9_9ASCO|nr:uncharacterized protein J8A68_000695 [[Candida] subhashii]KAG7665868.1 hypothetical protein J8A68_000695 [[Candida] subhashii]